MSEFVASLRLYSAVRVMSCGADPAVVMAPSALRLWLLPEPRRRCKQGRREQSQAARHIAAVLVELSVRQARPHELDDSHH